MPANGDRDDMGALKLLGDDMPLIDDAAKARARARLDRAIENERTSSRVSPRRWVAVAAAIIVISVVTPFFLTGSPLLELAAVASAQPTQAVPTGSFVYSRARVVAVSSDVTISGEELGSELVTIRRETWIAQDGSGLLLERRIGLDSDEEQRTVGGPGTFRLGDVNQLSTDPDALFEEIRGPGFLDDPEDDLEVLSNIGALLRDPYVSPAHREALFLIVADIEGVQVEEGFRDPAGRIGIAVTLRDSTRSVTLVFEPGTSRLLSEAEVRDGALSFEASYLETAVVPALGDRPEGSEV